jgi:predicted dehydrogenase
VPVSSPLAARDVKSPPRPIQLGALGVDSSHLSEFARRIHARFQAGQTRCRVTQMYGGGPHQMPAGDVEKWCRQAEAVGVVAAGRLESLLDGVDGVLVLAVGGACHLALAEPALRRGLSTFVDKPLACSLAEARKLQAVAVEHGARCFSASSLRFAGEVHALNRTALGRLVALDAYGPGEQLAANPGLFHYGVHTVELVDAIWGPGVARVRAWATPPRDGVELEYTDGRYARLRLEREGAYAFGATVHGAKATASLQVDFSGIYDRFVEQLTGFFEGAAAPVTLERLVENIATIEAAHRSWQSGGSWVEVAAEGRAG